MYPLWERISPHQPRERSRRPTAVGINSASGLPVISVREREGECVCVCVRERERERERERARESSMSACVFVLQRVEQDKDRIER